MTDTLKQFILYDADSKSEMVCWLDPAGITRSSLVELKEMPGVRWAVRKIYDTTIKRTDIKRGWHNNI